MQYFSRYNLRKFSELPHHLIGACMTDQLCQDVLFSYEWMHAKISAGPIASVLADFAGALKYLEDKGSGEEEEDNGMDGERRKKLRKEVWLRYSMVVYYVFVP